jgi:hypothetical protein
LPCGLAHLDEEQNEARGEHRKGLSGTKRSAKDEKIKQKLQARSGLAEENIFRREGLATGQMAL